MSDIATKLTYLNETKSQLKDMINYGLPTENQITNETTFRNYVKSIFEAFLESLRDSTTLYTNLPKKSGNGTQITLNDTANAPMRITLKASALSQDATPTPDSPQDIHTISGDNSVVVCGKNFISIPSNCVVTGGPNIIDLETPIPIGTYIVSIDSFINGGTNRGLIHFLNNNTQIAYALLDNSNKTRTISITSPITKLRLYSQNNASASIGITSTYVNMMVSINGGDYEPYVSQTAQVNLGNIEYCKIGDYEDKFILTSGKNLFDKDNIIENKRLNGSGVAQSDNGYYVSSFIKVEPNTKYIKNSPSVDAYHRFSYYSSNTESSFISNADSNTATTPSNCQYLRFCGLLTEINTTQLNKGETSLPYEPYGTNQWYLKKNIGKVVLDGSENWIRNSTYTNAYYVDNYFTDILQNANRTMLSDYFTYGGKMSSSAVVQVGQFYTWSTILDRIILGFDAPDLATFKTWLGSNNVSIYYVLNTPTYTQITGTLETQLENIYKNMLSYKGTTNVSQINNDLPFVLGVSALEDLS